MENNAQGGGPGVLVDPAADARTRLIQAGLEAFGLYNYEGASTRELARLAGVNLSAIPYHFGGKRGLYEAVVGHIAAQLLEKAGPGLEGARGLLENGEAGPEELLEALTAFLEQAARAMLLTPEARYWARIMLREQMLPTDAFDRLYRDALEPAHTTLTRLTARISGLPEDSPEAAIRAFCLLGQVLVFRAAQETVKRRLGWQAVDHENFELIRRVIHENTAAILRGDRSGEGR
jgi:AcrR family transcriptional regulator